MMKKIGGVFVALGMVLGATAHAEVVATARSPEGVFAEFRVVLDVMGAPVAVANFMGLADGSQKWVDPESGRVRGGAGDAFYDGMVFDMPDGNCVRGGMRPIPDGEGGVKYEGGAGFSALGKGKEAWTVVSEGTLAMVENEGPHNIDGELALYVTNGVTQWTAIGQVREADLPGMRELAALVQGGEVVAVEWDVDESGATAAERTALEAGRELLPEPFGMAAGIGADGAGFTLVLPASSRLAVFTSENLTGGFSYEGEAWNLTEEPGAMEFGWNTWLLTGMQGFVTLAGVKQPMWSGHKFQGKWWMGLDYPDHREEIWWDFTKGTGLVVMVVGGEATGTNRFSQASSWRETGNSIVAYYGRGFFGHYHYLGFSEAGATDGRFMYKQLYLIDEVGRTWGTFEMEEGWAREPGVVVGRGSKGTERAAGQRTRGGKQSADGGIQVRRKGGGGRTAGRRSRGEQELEFGVFGVGNARAEEVDAVFDIGKHGRGFGGGRVPEERGDIGFEGDGFVEASGEGEGDGEGVADDGVVGDDGVGAAGDGEDVGGGGG